MKIRGFLASLMAATVAACSNLVLSEKPLFDPAKFDANVRHGVWIGPPDKDCRFDVGAPTTSWPKCASPVVIGPDGPRLDSEEEAYRFVSGDPMIAEITPKEAPAAGEHAMTHYFAFAPTRRDHQGRITAVVGWPVQCGPPHRHRYPRGAGPIVPSTATRHPLPGLVMRDDNCIAALPETVRDAAIKSRAWSGRDFTYRWLRDGTR